MDTGGKEEYSVSAHFSTQFCNALYCNFYTLRVRQEVCSMSHFTILIHMLC